MAKLTDFLLFLVFKIFWNFWILTARMNQASFDCVRVIAKPLFHQQTYSFLYLTCSVILNTFPESQYAFMKTRWWSLERIVKIWWNFDKVIFPNCTGTGWGLYFNSQKTPKAESNWEAFNYSKHIHWQTIGNWPRLHFSGQILIHWLQTTIISPKMLRLKCQFKIYIVL